ncbi:MAG: MqnA/MqnD/SBP family protein [Candidatus Caenarcaniphilales bacterium]|nr:MqnA/MqnD/SBP family protein [Candidatus Caenarcaniphilales bacterium]
MRIGITSYLNCLPIHYGLDSQVQVLLSSPQDLRRMLLAKEIDFAQISLLDYLKNQDQLELYDRFWVIASGLEIRSVLLVTNQPIESFHSLSTVFLTSESATANRLCEILLEGRYQKKPTFHRKNISLGDLDLLAETDLPCGLTLIGDLALDLLYTSRIDPQYDHLHIYDLHKLWRLWMQLPFPFAVFASWRGVQLKEEKTFQMIQQNLIKNLQTPQYFLNYLTDSAQGLKFSYTFLEEYYNLLSYSPSVNDWDAILRFAELAHHPLMSRASRLISF